MNNREYQHYRIHTADIRLMHINRIESIVHYMYVCTRTTSGRCTRNAMSETVWTTERRKLGISEEEDARRTIMMSLLSIAHYITIGLKHLMRSRSENKR